MLSFNFRCDQIRNNDWREFGHTLLPCLGPNYMLNKPTLQYFNMDFKYLFYCPKIVNLIFESGAVQIFRTFSKRWRKAEQKNG